MTGPLNILLPTSARRSGCLAATLRRRAYGRLDLSSPHVIPQASRKASTRHDNAPSRSFGKHRQETAFWHPNARSEASLRQCIQTRIAGAARTGPRFEFVLPSRHAVFGLV
ncbi:hypothetical protein Bxe_A2583 [Paraburkholderia xenovorans LB400]|uniref:Uncharacterized protein n=1 Tax=Paraburkholderia xenovorans (strain LB400) TaxID=266265 RepID=Q13ZU2_PARXL|nr:hypothetical protein Bxe_A2583 [Paraburkholderia xenovorans LB400]